jgi:hypothetical protein
MRADPIQAVKAAFFFELGNASTIPVRIDAAKDPALEDHAPRGIGARAEGKEIGARAGGSGARDQKGSAEMGLK